jgi:hypothetical protein
MVAIYATVFILLCNANREGAGLSWYETGGGGGRPMNCCQSIDKDVTVSHPRSRCQQAPVGLPAVSQFCCLPGRLKWLILQATARRALVACRLLALLCLAAAAAVLSPIQSTDQVMLDAA